MAARRVPILVDAGAEVTIVAPAIDPRLRALIHEGRCVYWARPYNADDCVGMFLVLAATGVPAVDAEVSRQAQAQRALLCVASDQALGNCIFMATVRRGPLVVALHTDGAAPAVTAAVRRRFDDQLPVKLGDDLDALAEIRAKLRAEVSDPAERARRWRVVVESGVLNRLLAQDDGTALGEVCGILTPDEQFDSAHADERTNAEESEYI